MTPIYFIYKYMLLSVTQFWVLGFWFSVMFSENCSTCKSALCLILLLTCALCLLFITQAVTTAVRKMDPITELIRTINKIVLLIICSSARMFSGVRFYILGYNVMLGKVELSLTFFLVSLTLPHLFDSIVA